MITNFLKQVNGYSGNNVIVEKQIVLKSSCTGGGGLFRYRAGWSIYQKNKFAFFRAWSCGLFSFCTFSTECQDLSLKKTTSSFLNNAKMWFRNLYRRILTIVYMYVSR